jgi:D-3-phosphoglycerate dehydrogenase
VQAKVLVAEPIAQDGIDLLAQHTEVHLLPDLGQGELLKVIGQYDGLVIRSGTKVTEKVIEAGERLRVIARAGIGVDNIDVAAATRRGIVVVNAPGGSTIAAAEHTIALILALARHLPQADASLRAGKWQRQRFIGTEIRHKTLGVIGLGKIGTEVARRGQALEMRVLAFDPFVSQEYAQYLGVELAGLEEVIRQADFLTVHTPLTESTRGLIGARELAMMKPTARVVNCARGGIIDEEALLVALEEGRLAGAALDVFSQEPPAADSPLLRSPRIIVTPHLGAMTQEAQVSVAVDIAQEVITVLRGQQPRYAVNAPLILPEALAVLSPFVEVAEVLGCLATQLVGGQLGTIEIRYSGEISLYDTTPLKASVIKGLLAPVSEEQVNLINAHLVARSRGLRIIEYKEAQSENYASLVTVKITTSEEERTVSGTMMAGAPHLVSVNGYWVDVPLEKGYLLFGEHLDRPGIIGKVGTLLGAADVNISFMQVGRHQPRGKAVMILGLDEPITEELRQQLLDIPDISSVKLARL